MRSAFSVAPAILFASTVLVGCGADSSDGQLEDGTGESFDEVEAIGQALGALSPSLWLEGFETLSADTTIVLDNPLPRIDLEVESHLLDWNHWGKDSATSRERQRGKKNAVNDVVMPFKVLGTGTPVQDSTNAPLFIWNQGSPTKVNSEGTRNGVLTSGQSNGFQVRFRVQDDYTICSIYGQAFGANVSTRAKINTHDTIVTKGFRPGNAFVIRHGFSGDPGSILAVNLKAGAGGSVALYGASCSHMLEPRIALTLERRTSGHPWYWHDLNHRLQATANEHFESIRFYADGLDVGGAADMDGDGLFEVDHTPPAGFHFYQAKGWRSDGTTYTTPPVRVPVWAGSFLSATTAIPDYPGAGLDQSISIANVPNKLKVFDVYSRIHIDHTWDADLKIQMVAPDGAAVTMADDNGSDGDNFFYTDFWDEAGPHIDDGVAPFEDAYRPKEPFAAFKGKTVNGNWRMTVTDETPADVGTWYWKGIWILAD